MNEEALLGKSILVTGGAGFIGSHIVERCVRAGARVTVYDNFTSGSTENLEAVLEDVEIIHGDIQDIESLAGAMAGKDLVSHQAAQLEITKCIQDPVADLATNAIGTLNVLSTGVRMGVSRTVVASSACVYGQSLASVQTEKHPTQPNWPYGVSKLAAEHYARLFSEYYGLAVTSLRYGIVYGPREWYGRVLTIFLRRALDGRPLVIFGDGRQLRDFVFVGDVVDLHQRCLVDNQPGWNVYNAGTGVATSIADLAGLVRQTCGSRAEIVYEDPEEGGYSSLVPERPRLPAELRGMVLSSQRATDQLGWKPNVGLEEGLRREIDWVRIHAHRWSAVHV